MSLPDHELEPESICDEHGLVLPCWECRADLADLYAEMEYQDAVER